MSAKSNILCQILFYQSPSISAKKEQTKNWRGGKALRAGRHGRRPANPCGPRESPADDGGHGGVDGAARGAPFAVNHGHGLCASPLADGILTARMLSVL